MMTAQNIDLAVFILISRKETIMELLHVKIYHIQTKFFQHQQELMLLVT